MIDPRNEELRQFLAALYPDPLPAGVTILVRGVPVDPSKAPRTEHYTSIEALLADRERLDSWNEEGYSIFFSPTLRDGRNGDKVHCIALPSLWFECDAKEHLAHAGNEALISVGQAAIDHIVRAFTENGGPAPSIVTNSGGGKQGYWLLKDTVLRRDGKANREEWFAFMKSIESTLAAIQPELRSDQARLNFDSLLRLPTFVNPKYAHRPVCAVVFLDSERRYALSDFSKYAPADAGRAAEVQGQGDDSESPIVRAFKERDLYIREAGNKHLVICPWNDEHSGQGSESKTVLFTDGETITGFKCLGAHCAARRLGDVFRRFGIDGEPVEIVDGQPEEQSYLFPLPGVAFQGLAHEYAEMMSGSCGTDYNYWYFSYLALFAASVSTHVRIGDFTKRPLRPYAVMIGPKGTGKSQARDMTHDFFVGLRTMTPETSHYHVIRNANSDQGIVAAATAADEHALVFMPDEFASVLKKCGIQNSTLGQTLTELYEKEDTDAWTKDEKKKAAPMLKAHLTIIGGTTPSDFAAHFDALTAFGGLYSRFWLVAGSRPYQYRGVRPPEPARLHDIRIRTRDAIRRAIDGPGVIDLSQEAQRRLDAWAEAQGATLQTEVAVRITDHITKLAAILALIRGGAMVDDVDMETALALGDWELDVRRAFQIDAAETRGARWALAIKRAIWNRVQDRPGAAVPDREIRRAVHEYKWAPGAYAGIVRHLEEAGELEKVPLARPRQGGWTPVAWKVGPAGLRGIDDDR